MSEAPDKDSKTEEPTEKKVRDSIEKGKLPASKEAPVLASFGAILVFVLFFAHDGAVRLGMFLSIFLEKPDSWPLETEFDAIALYRIVALEIARALAAVMVLLIAAGLAASMIQNAPRFVADRIAPKLSRISLKQGFTRVFGQQGMVEFAKSVGKIGFAVACLCFVLAEVAPELLSGMMTHPVVFADVIRDLAVEILFAMISVMVLIAAADVLWSRFHWWQELKMTHQEVKDELKQTDGDPIVKMRIKSLQRDRSRRRMMGAVPKATLVIANPTHYAIALRYERDMDAAPIVVAKGMDLVALRIREIAEANGVPVFEDVALARSMYKQVSVDSMIPSQFYQAVAELVRIVYGQRAKPKPRRDH
jgi:flagellar biosynthesis protein FlhB